MMTLLAILVRETVIPEMETMTKKKQEMLMMSRKELDLQTLMQLK
jgi:hypothetical protein